MPQTDARVDAYIKRAPAFAQPMLVRIRKAFHKGCPQVVETIKWGWPAFEHHGLLGGMAAFKQHVSYGFWRGEDLDDPDGLFPEAGGASVFGAKPASLKELPTQAVLAAYVRRAAALNEEIAAGTRPKTRRQTPKRRLPPKVPADLAEALAADASAKAFFRGLAPSHQREYVEWIVEAKREATRAKRVATTIAWLAEGKRRNWRYEGRS